MKARQYNISIDEALQTLDDDQLIDYILEMPDSEVKQSPLKGFLITKRMRHWKKFMEILGELRRNRLINSEERDRVRGWLVKKEYDTVKLFLDAKKQLYSELEQTHLFEMLIQELVNIKS